MSPTAEQPERGRRASSRPPRRAAACASSSTISRRVARRRWRGEARRRSSASTPPSKLTARERIALLVDEGTFVELGIQGRPHFAQPAMQGVEAPADGVVTGFGEIDGRLACVAAYDFTVMAGSMGATGELKVTRLREMALTKRIPFIWLLDSAGARIQEAAGSLFAGTGQLFREEVVMSGVIPQVAALMGPCAAGTAYIPALADFVPMVKGRGSMALAGPPPREGGHRRGGHAGGARRLAGALPGLRRRRHRGRIRRGVHRDDQALPLVLPAELRRAAAAARVRGPGRPHGRGAAGDPPGLLAQALRHVRDRHAASSTTASTSTSRGPSRSPSSPAWRAWAASRWGSWPTSPSTSAGSSRTTPPTRRRASSTSATPSRSRSSSSRTCPASWSARRSRPPASSGTGRRCSTRSPTRPFRRSR